MNERILVLQHSPHEGPAALGRYLDGQDIGWTLRRLDRGEPVPEAVADWRGVVLLGGVMSAYDDTVPFIGAELRFIESLLALACPILGICLGAQLLARVFGARVTRMPAREIGWHPVQATLPGTALVAGAGYSGELPQVFQWHGDAFDLPTGALRLFTGKACPEQGFCVGSHVLGVQFHPEVDRPTLQQWVADENPWLADPGGQPHVQPAGQLLAEAPARLAALRPLSEALYRAWLNGVQGSREGEGTAAVPVPQG